MFTSPGKTWENQPVRGGPDTVDKLRRHAERTARAGALDGGPLLGISVFAVLDMSLDDLLRRRFTSFRTIYLPTAGRLAEGCAFLRSVSFRDAPVMRRGRGRRCWPGRN